MRGQTVGTNYRFISPIYPSGCPSIYLPACSAPPLLSPLSLLSLSLSPSETLREHNTHTYTHTHAAHPWPLHGVVEVSPGRREAEPAPVDWFSLEGNTGRERGTQVLHLEFLPRIIPSSKYPVQKQFRTTDPLHWTCLNVVVYKYL